MKRIIVILLFFPFFMLAQNEDWIAIVSIINEERVNTENPEFSPSFWQDYIVFVSSRPRKSSSKDQESTLQYDLYLTAPTSNKRLERSAIFSRELNTPYDEAQASFFNGGNSMYYTHMDYEGAEDLGLEYSYLQVFESHLVDGVWQEPINIIQNQQEIHSCHPTTNSDNSILIFSSDRPEGYGKMDLYISYNESGIWTEPRNMGPAVNTEMNDWFPFLHDNGYLFFSSDSPDRGLEIHRLKINEDNSLTGKLLMPAPFNSRHDDFGFICDKTGRSGYLSSDRVGSKGHDDIYAFETEKSVFAFGDESYNLIDVVVKDMESKKPFAQAKIRFKKIDDDKFKAFDDSIFLFDPNENYDSLYTDFNGSAQFRIFDGHTLVEITGSNTESWTKVIANDVRNSHLEVFLMQKAIPKTPEPIKNIRQDEILGEVDMNIGSVLVFDNIYYDYNSYEIKKGAAIELDALSRIMRENPTLKILLSAHTDSRGTKTYNQNLSNRRAIAAKNYLIQRGVNPGNISTVGFGETQLRNHCSDNVKCSESEHNFNRRTEVQIIDN